MLEYFLLLLQLIHRIRVHSIYPRDVVLQIFAKPLLPCGKIVRYCRDTHDLAAVVEMGAVTMGGATQERSVGAGAGEAG